MVMALHLVPRVLKYMECVAQHGSIQSASRELGISASAIHRQIVLIEEDLGEVLFERDPKGLILTPTGSLILELARRWRLDNARLMSTVQANRGVEQGHFRLAAMDSMVNGFVLNLVQATASAFPKVTIDIEIMSPGDATKGVLNGDFDLAAVANAAPNEALEFHWRREFPLGCIATWDHPLAAEESISFSTFISYPVVFQSSALSIRKLLEARHSWLFEQARTAVVVNSIQLMKLLVATGRYVAVTSEIDAGPELQDGRLAFVPINDEDVFKQNISLISNAQMPPSKLREKIQEIAVQCLDNLSVSAGQKV
ncbi:LysR family transcriptional regulator [Ruegeria marina]|uniref:DNA-binding transcriptional regulator, LysR family n=1 Tax=Ruegeria marina TaxID=639004 RepID=A0A1G6VFV1_9RHOB|nr:LysR family transcriptional regulator [Ruegeria marina]SDD52213.1 DNA-binding transcriptional regulator, LysR family [Ruegeria marina]